MVAPSAPRPHLPKLYRKLSKSRRDQIKRVQKKLKIQMVKKNPKTLCVFLDANMACILNICLFSAYFSNLHKFVCI